MDVIGFWSLLRGDSTSVDQFKGVVRFFLTIQSC
jgi:hypothetical protein